MKHEFTKGSELVHYTVEELKVLKDAAEVEYRAMLAFHDAQRDALRKPMLQRPPVPCFHTRDWMTKSAHTMGVWNLGEYEVLMFGSRSQNPEADAIKRLDDCDYEIRRLIAKNNEFYNRLVKGLKLRPPDFFAWTTKVAGSEINANLHVIYRNLKLGCEKCGQKVNPSRLPVHQKTVKCAEDARLKQVRDAGLEYTNNKLVMNAVKRGTIPGELVPCKYTVYVPKWVSTAAKLYTDKETKKNYAGLTFDQFMTSMKAE